MEPNDGYSSGGEKRKTLKRNLSEAEFFGENEAFFSSWNPDMHGAKSPDPSADVGVDTENLMFGVDNNIGDPSEYEEEEDEQHVLYNSNGAGMNGVLSNGWPPAIAGAPAKPYVTVNTATMINVEDWNQQEREDTVSAPRRRKKPKPKCGPQRPLSAYNLFFRDYRRCLIQETGGSVPFVTMGKEVGKKWKSLSNRERHVWEQRAEQESLRYREELAAFKEKNKKKRRSVYPNCLDDVKPDVPQEALLRTYGLAEQPAAEPATPSSSVELREGFTFRQETFHPNWANSNMSRNNNPGTTHSIYPFDQGRQEQRQSSSALPLPSPSRLGLNNTSLPEFVDMAAATGRTPLSKAREVVNLPEGFTFPEGLPPSGTEIFLPDGSGALRPHKLFWKVYSLPAADAESFMGQFKYGEEAGFVM